MNFALKSQLLLITCAIGAFSSPALRADESIMGFLEGLRDRDYFDTAVEYLERLEKSADVPAEVKELIPYEKGITYIRWAPQVENPKNQMKHYDRAKRFLEDFLNASPQHEKAAVANTEVANVFIGKAKVNVMQARSPNNAAEKDDFQKNARANLAEARKVFQAAHDRYEAAYKAFPTFIDKVKEKSKYGDREKAMVTYIQAQLNLAIATYEEAQTYDLNSPEYKKKLTEASSEFEKIHAKYRSQLAGLYARMWQGKCLEEQGDITKALGMYKEFFCGDYKRSAVIKRLQDRVLQFRLICLNHEQRKDYLLVIDEANAWMNENRSGNLRRTSVGLGILWEKARAEEFKARMQGTPKEERDRRLNRALLDAREINKYPGEYKDASHEMIKRCMAVLKGSDH